MFDESVSEPNYAADRDTAILWARSILTADFVVLDTETTGLADDDEVIQLAIVGKAGQVLLDCLVSPRKPIPAKATAIHGIRDEDVRDAPDIAYYVPILCHLLSRDAVEVLIYNADFDTRILAQTIAERGEILFLGRQTHCVMSWFAQFYGDYNDYHESYRWHKLTEAARHFNIKTDGAHGAVADARMTLEVVKAMARAKLSTEENGND